MNPDYNTLLRFYRAATGGGYNNVPVSNPMPNMVQPMPQAQQNVLPPQTVIQVNGKSSVDALRMSPNSSVLLMDTTQPVVWLCTSDGLGNVTSVAYDIVQHKDAPPIDVNSLENRVTTLENILTNLMGGNKENDKSNASTDKQRKDKHADGKPDNDKK